MPTNYNFTNKTDFLKLKFPNVSSSGRRLFLLGDQTGMSPGPNQENAAFRFANTSVVTLNSANLSPGKENEALRITPIGINNPWQSIDLYVALTPRPDLLDFAGGTTRTYRVSFSYRANASSVGKTFSTGLYDVPFGGSGSTGYGNNSSITIADTNWNRVENISGSRTFASDRWVGFGGFRALSPNNTWTSSDYIEIADFSFTWDEQPTTTISFDNQFIPADTFRQGNLWSSGQVWNGRLADGQSVVSTVGSTTAVRELPPSSNWRQIATSIYNGAGIKSDGSLWTWGLNNYGSIGDNSLSTRLSPRREFTSSTNWNSVSVGSIHMCAIKSDGTLWCWGRNDAGQLATNDNVNRLTPVQEFTSSSNWKQVSCAKLGNSITGTLALKTDGTIWGWGNNGYGQLGVNDNIARSTPVQEFSSSNNWKQISMGAFLSSYAIKNNQTLWSWGYNINGQLGVNDNIARSTPVQEFTSSANWKQVSGGSSYFQAIKNDGTIWGAGDASFGALGITGGGNRLTPIQEQTSSTNWKKLSCGDFSSAIKTNGTLWGWGPNTYGQLCNGTTSTSVQTAVQEITLKTTWKDVASGNSHRSAIEYIDPII